jgi:16S rRNA (guanine527-N7)-methyltransferase
MEEIAAKLLLATDSIVPRGTMDQIEFFIDFLQKENEVQNLVSKASMSEIWNRHILDSVQLLRFAPSPDANWIDLGTGAGFPGIIIALLHSGHVTLVEERKKRAEFLMKAVELLAIGNKVRVAKTRVERMKEESFAVISARAFAPLAKIFTLGERFSTEKTRWILPKGRNVRSELAEVQSSWQGDFRLEPSLTDADAAIIVAERVSRRLQGQG